MLNQSLYHTTQYLEPNTKSNGGGNHHPLVADVGKNSLGSLKVNALQTVIRQRRVFSVAGPTAWNGLPVVLRLTPVPHSALFLYGLKTTLFDLGWAGRAPE